MTRKFKVVSLVRKMGVCLVGTLFLAGAFLGYRQVSGNFHAVVKGEVYRAAQPTADQVTRYVQENGIRSILDLRGAPGPQSPRFQAEYVTAQKLGVAHYEFRMSARKQLTQEEAAQLIDIMRKAEKPLLIHCQAGADRSGLASALYLAAIANESEGKAEGQLSFWYGHISLPISEAFAMDMTWEKLEPWLGFPNS
ncbi:dual specificity protein phosphatase family protein (plasmid) [Rhizobium lusitanum]|uniref:tyrosine-protein phosphatase n=1 Tax=Rhizobium lusitanum TaxID=293958 RepID=UPI00160EDC8E|nr:tyrosine-protein phosphatase [Rhizobium lusitanum]QND44314.1 dual specificity protein phosphatase family protein [Rhizobium lusitanum]